MERHGAQPSANAVDWVHISNVFHTNALKLPASWLSENWI